MKRMVLARVIANREVAREHFVLWMETPEIAHEGRPGQFLMVRCGDPGDGLLLRRPMSIYRFGAQALRMGGETATINPEGISIFFEVRGRGTQWLARRRAGDVLDVIGPLGNGFAPPGRAQRWLVAAGGIGLGGVASLVDEGLEQGRAVRLLYGAATGEKVYPFPLEHPALTVRYATDDGTLGYHGRVTGLLPEHCAWADAVFACGPTPMFAAMAALWRREGWSLPVQALMEARMGCGLGACFGCSVPTVSGCQRVCTYGPRYDLQELLFDNAVLREGA